MKVTITKEDLKAVLEAALKAVSPNGPLPILSHFMLTGKNGTLTAAASNLDRAVIAETKAHIDVEGCFTVPAKPFYDIISLMPPNGTVTIEREEPEGQCVIQGDGSKCALVTLDAADFPVLPATDDYQWKTTTTQGALLEALKRVSFAMPPVDDARAVLNGVFLSLRPVGESDGGVFGEGDTAECVFKATDAKKLSVAVMESIPNSFVGDWPSEKKGVVIPKSTVNELIKLLKPCSESVDVGEAGKCFFVKTNGVVMTSRLVEGNYPDVDRLVSASFGCSAVMDKKAFARGLETALVFSKDINAPGLIQLRFGEGEVAVIGRTGDVGDGRKWVPCAYSPAPPDEKDADAYLNGKYLLEALKAMSQDVVAVEFNGGESPFMIRGSRDSSKKHVALVMPMRPA